MADRLRGKVAIVTGAGRGIGKAEAMALAAEGASVVVNDLGVDVDGFGLDKSPADATVAEILGTGSQAVASYDDITRMEGGRALVELALKSFGRLDILVNNAGIQMNRTVFEITEDEFDRTVAVHIKGHWSTIQAAIEVFREQSSGCIINTGSMGGLGQPRHVDYCAAKEGIAGMTRALALELLRYGVRVNCIRPRAVTRMGRTPRPGPLAPPPPPASNRAPPISTVTDPAAVGAMVVYLASDAAKDVTGQDFFVQGGEISLLTLPLKARTLVREDGWDIDAIERVFPGTLGALITAPVSY